MLAVVLASNLLLENFVEPRVMGRTLDIHPLTVLLVTALGGIVGRIVGQQSPHAGSSVLGLGAGAVLVDHRPRFGSIATFVFGLPGLRRLAARPTIARFFDLDQTGAEPTARESAPSSAPD